jgi:hypothetical protein
LIMPHSKSVNGPTLYFPNPRSMWIAAATARRQTVSTVVHCESSLPNVGAYVLVPVVPNLFGQLLH